MHGVTPGEAAWSPREFLW